MFKQEITVRFNDCDPMGHVNNAVYYTYFEEARTDIFQLFNPDLNLRTWNLIVASTQCDYLHEALYAEKLTVWTWIGHIGRSSFDCEHAIQNAEGKWLARGKGTLLGYNFETKLSVPLTDELRAELLIHNEPPKDVPRLRGS